MPRDDYGLVSMGYSQGYDTFATRRSLDTTGRTHGEFRPKSSADPRFVQVSYQPSGYSHDVKLHSNTCMVDGLASLYSDPARWTGRLSIGKTLYSGVLAPRPEGQEEKPAPSQPSGYSRVKVWSDTLAAGGATIGPVAPSLPTALWTTATTTIPSGYSLNRKVCGLAEIASETDDDPAARFAVPETRVPPTAASNVVATKVSAYSRSTASASSSMPYAASPFGALHPTQARLHAVRAPEVDRDPHWHKMRS